MSSMENRAPTKQDWLRIQEEVRHRQIVAVNQAPTPTPSLYFGTRRCTYSDVVSVVTTVKPLPRFGHDTTTIGRSVKAAWDVPGPVTHSVDREDKSLPFVQSGNGAAHYVQAPLEGDSERDQRFLARQVYALQQERAAFMTELYTRRKQRYLVEQHAALVIQRVYRGSLLRRRFLTIKEKLRVRKRIRVNLVKVTKGTAIITGEKERKAHILAHQHEAARRVQTAFRRWTGRRVLQRERALQIQELRHQNAIRIQCVWRRAVAKAVVPKLRERLAQERRQTLARVVTRLYCGYQARQRVRRLRLRQQTLASQRIQDSIRCFHARKALRLQRYRRRQQTVNRAARTIQKHVRGMLARARVARLRLEEDLTIRVACALMIQRVLRGFRSRQYVRYVRLFSVYARASICGLHFTRIVRGFLGRQCAKYKRWEQETDLLVQTVRGNTSTVIDLLDGYGLVDEPVDLTTTNPTTLNHTLHLACRHGHMAILTHVLPQFLEHAPQLVYARNAKGATPLELAVLHGHESLASFLLTKTPDLFLTAPPRKLQTTQAPRSRSLLLEAAHQCMGMIVTKLMVLFPQLFDAKTDRDSWSQRTVLHEVLLCSRERYEDTKTIQLHNETMDVTLRTLLKLHVDINAQDLVGFTPLHIAAMQGNLKVVQTLLDFDADVTIQDREGRTAWRLALLHGQETCFLEIRRKWLGDVSNGTPLIPPDEAADTDMVKALVQAEAKGPSGLSRRRRVAANLHPHLAGPVLQAARNGDVDRIRFLLEECHANVNACDSNGDGDSLVMVVLREKNLRLLRYLLDAFGEDLNFTYVNNAGHSVVDAALHSPRLLTVLIQEGFVNPCLPLDSTKQHRTTTHEAIRRGYDVNEWLRGYMFMPSMLVPLADDTGRTPLHDAAAFGNVASGRLLLNAGLQGDVRDGQDRRTPLHDACRSGAVVLVQKLVQKWPQALWMRDAAGQLPIQATVALGNLDLVEELVVAMRPGVPNGSNDAVVALEKFLRDAKNETRPLGSVCKHETGTQCECQAELEALVRQAFEAH